MIVRFSTGRTILYRTVAEVRRADGFVVLFDAEGLEIASIPGSAGAIIERPGVVVSLVPDLAKLTITECCERLLTALPDGDDRWVNLPSQSDLRALKRLKQRLGYFDARQLKWQPNPYAEPDAPTFDPSIPPTPDGAVDSPGLL